jgi:hypothetical protein
MDNKKTPFAFSRSAPASTAKDTTKLLFSVLQSAVLKSASASVRLGESFLTQLPSFAVARRRQEHAVALARAASARIAVAGKYTTHSAQFAASAVKLPPVLDARAHWIWLRDRTVFGALKSASASVRLGESFRAQLTSFAVICQRQEHAVAVARAASVRIAEAGKSVTHFALSAASAVKLLPGRVVPDVRARWIRLRNRTVFGALVVVFVYAAGTATPQAIANYQLESQKRGSARHAAEAAAEGRETPPSTKS